MLIFKYVINPTAVSCTLSCFRVQQQLDQGERQSQRFFQAFYFFFKVPIIQLSYENRQQGWHF